MTKCGQSLIQLQQKITQLTLDDKR